MSKLSVSPLLEKAIRLILVNVGQALHVQYQGLNIELEQIEHESYPGFWAWNNGGYMFNLYLDIGRAWASGQYFHSDIRAFIENQENICFDAFCHENGLNPEDIDLILNMPEFWDYQNDWMVQEYLITIRAVYYKADNWRNDSGKDKIVFDLAYNLSEYGNDNDAVNVYRKEVLVENLTIPLLKQIKDELLAFV